MKYLFFLLITCSINCSNKELFVKYAICKSVPFIFVETTGEYEVYNPIDNSLIMRGNKNSAKIIPHENRTGITWGSSFPGIYQIKITPKANSTILVNGKQYLGNMIVYLVEQQLHVVNEIEIEDLLVSLLHNVSNEYLPTTLEAVSIVLRTNIYQYLYNRQNNFVDIYLEDLDYHCYGSMAIDQKIADTAKKTKNIVMFYKGRPFPSTVGENYAGITSSYSTIHRTSKESPNGILLPYENKDQLYWKYQISKEDLLEYINLKGLEEIELFKEEHKKRVYGIRYKYDDNRVDQSFLELQNILGYENIPSNYFNVVTKENNLIFEGYGSGTGIGLCMYTSDQMADQGYTTKQILETFFPEVMIVDLSFLL